MFERYIVCDRCGKRKLIQNRSVADAKYGSLRYDEHNDDRIRAYHLCDSCNNEFKEFMRIGENTSENE